ncbi:MAG: hypothetical protein ACI93T_002058 [Porticoccaceae bacterium]
MNCDIPLVHRMLMIVAILFVSNAFTGCQSGDNDTPSPVEFPEPSVNRVSESSEESPFTFVECAAQLGVSHTYHSGSERGFFAIVESLGGGVAMIDYDNDGLVDLFAPGGGDFVESSRQPIGRRSQLFRRISRVLNESFVEVSAMAQVSESDHYSHGSLVSDYDNDGFDDILLTGYGGVQLFRNSGDGTFIEVAANVGLTDSLWSSSAAWGDFNGNGANDVYIAHYVDWSPENDPQCFADDASIRDVCPPKLFSGLTDALYLSDGQGNFVFADESFGDLSSGKGLGVAAADVDLDGDLDVYVANDTVKNSLLINDSEQRFVEAGPSSGTAYGDTGREDGSMGVDIGDFNGDGLPDIWVTNYENESFALYRGFDGDFFQHVSRSTGVSAAAGLSVGWGTVFGDFDLDGDEDLFAANGHVIRHPTNSPIYQRPLLLLNDEKRRFTDVARTSGTYLAGSHMSRGVVQGDLDDDGDIDLIISNIHQPLAVLRNESPRQGNWIRLKLIGVESARWAEGAWVEFLLKGNRKILRLRKGGTSYASTSDRWLHAGIGTDKLITAIEIHWPSGSVQRLENVSVNQHLQVVEGCKDYFVASE